MDLVNLRWHDLKLLAGLTLSAEYVAETGEGDDGAIDAAAWYLQASYQAPQVWYARKLEKPLSDISARSISLLERYHWPGNVRERQNMIERVAVLAKVPLIEVDGVLGRDHGRTHDVLIPHPQGRSTGTYSEDPPRARLGDRGRGRRRQRPRSPAGCQSPASWVQDGGLFGPIIGPRRQVSAPFGVSRE
ncbi:MAG: hypothetical protein ACRED0_03355 [Gammaproteobacteria bacterium]